MRVRTFNNNPTFGATITIKDPKKILQGAAESREIYWNDQLKKHPFTENDLMWIQTQFEKKTKSMKGHLEVDVDYRKAYSEFGEDKETSSIKYFRENVDGSKVYETSLPIKILYGFSRKGLVLESPGRNVLDVTGLTDADQKALYIEGFVDCLVKSFKTLKYISKKEKQTARLMKQKEILDESIENKLNRENIGFAIDGDWLKNHERMKQIQKNILKDSGKEIRIEKTGYYC